MKLFPVTVTVALLGAGIVAVDAAKKPSEDISRYIYHPQSAQGAPVNTPSNDNNGSSGSNQPVADKPEGKTQKTGKAAK